MQVITQSESSASRRRVFFVAVSVNDLQERLTGLTPASFTVRISKNGDSDSDGDNLVSEHDPDEFPGLYFYECSEDEVNTLGVLVLRIAYEGMEPREIAVQIVAASTAATAADVGNLVLDENAPAGMQTLKEMINIIAAYVAGEGLGFPFGVQQTQTYKSLDGTKTRLAGTISGGRRTRTTGDGT